MDLLKEAVPPDLGSNRPRQSGRAYQKNLGARIWELAENADCGTRIAECQGCSRVPDCVANLIPQSAIRDPHFLLRLPSDTSPEKDVHRAGSLQSRQA